ncbi:PREDICTED: (-)-alpha-pinene synthase-like [Fragaria vesca subsp. vesca]|uniref:(-)-alpha-pinene synthase-like n=1 Tax=Fragaria vesca subsp. vesca TaxID=101020 RepID=UPI0002C36284|nr:PREDICTED: (-)-alpha-pinene synthase-like [Fragaria vesca subsp. vesca]
MTLLAHYVTAAGGADGTIISNLRYFSITRAHMEKQINQLKVLVRELLTSTAAGLSHQLKFIDDIQRLGVSYHFETELAEALENIHSRLHDGDLDLYNDTLRFRLLRQHGYNIQGDIFKKFKDANGNFKESLIADVPGMLSLYEATHLRVHGEEILEEALVFTTNHLELAISQVSCPLKAQISEALERPMWRSLERLSARNYIPIYQATTSHNEALLKLAKLDFNLVQALYKEELSEVSRWWKELDFERKMPFARHRIVECFFWMMGMYYEPKYSVGRKIGTKLCAMATMLDDIFDSYGTFEELKIFRQVIERWDVNCCMDDLPRYMKVYYHSLCDVMNEIEEELEKLGMPDRIHYAKQVLKDQARDYLVEAEWLHEGCTLSMEEYLPVRVQSVGVCMTVVFSLLGMNDNITKETFEWVLKYPKIVMASSFIFRFMDDIGGSKHEKQKGDVDSSIDCYMKQYGVSKEEAIEVLDKQIVDSWKEINEDLLRPTAVPMYVLLRVMNFSRDVDLVYKGEDGFTHVGKVVKHAVAALFGDPLPLE